LYVLAERKTALRVAVGILVSVAVVRFVSREWRQISAVAGHLTPDWVGLLAASLCVVAGYAVLIAAWRMLLATWHSPLGFRDSARIWFVSSLGKYIPGKLWSVGAMAVLAKEAGASPVAATGSAVIMQLVNIAAGFVVIAVAGAGDLFIAYPVLRSAAWITLAASALGLALGPRLLAWGVRTATTMVRRPAIALPDVPRRTLLVVFGANVAAWVAYGLGFGLFWSALLGRGGGVSVAALAVYTASYLLGFLAIFAPGGIGVREAVLAGLLITLRLATPADAAMLAAASRVWLTVLEVLPGLAFLPGLSLRDRSSISTPDGPSA
jgi:glycosyltransferase 2 family protein